MNRVRLVALGALLAAAIAIGILATPEPAAPAAETSRGLPAPTPLAFAWARLPPNACGTCHAGWHDVAAVEALRQESGNGSRVSLTVSPLPRSEYSFPIVAAARGAADASPPIETRETITQLQAGTARVEVDVDAARAITVEALALDSYRRPPLDLVVRLGEGEAVEGEGSPAYRHVVLTGEGGALLSGRLGIEVRAADVADGAALVRVIVRTLPEAYDVAVNATGAVPARFAWAFPASAGPPVPDSFHVVALAFNPHPTDRWMITTNADHALYEGSTTLDSPPPPPNWTEAELDAIWAGANRTVLFEERFEGVVAYARNDRGEWTRERRGLEDPVFGRPPRPQGGFLPIPPGTARVEARLEWTGADPLAPAPNWILGVSLPPRPDFAYPEPAHRNASTRLDVVPVTPEAWQAGDEGAFQAVPRLALDDSGRASFAGSYRFVVEAVRH